MRKTVPTITLIVEFFLPIFLPSNSTTYIYLTAHLHASSHEAKFWEDFFHLTHVALTVMMSNYCWDWLAFLLSLTLILKTGGSLVFQIWFYESNLWPSLKSQQRQRLLRKIYDSMWFLKLSSFSSSPTFTVMSLTIHPSSALFLHHIAEASQGLLPSISLLRLWTSLMYQIHLQK